MSHRLCIIYESPTGNTHKMAQAVAEGARKVKGVEVLPKKVSEATAEELANADGIILGAPTRNTKIAPAMSRFLKEMKEVALQGKLGAAFGSYGWSGEAVGLIRSAMIAQGILVPGVGCEPREHRIRRAWRNVANWARGWPGAQLKKKRKYVSSSLL